MERELGTILGIWAHPDDEAYLSGGLMAAARDRGDRVVVVTATAGERGTPDPQRWPPDRMAALRRTELDRCLEILGVDEHHWLDYPDGECASVPLPEAVARLSEFIAEVRPDTVLTFGPDGITGHPDHRAVAAWAATAFDRAAQPSARLLQAAANEGWARRFASMHDEFEMFLPGYPIVAAEHQLALHLVLPDEAVERKVRALAAQESQTAALIASIGADAYAAWVREEAYLRRH